MVSPTLHAFAVCMHAKRVREMRTRIENEPCDSQKRSADTHRCRDQIRRQILEAKIRPQQESDDGRRRRLARSREQVLPVSVSVSVWARARHEQVLLVCVCVCVCVCARASQSRCCLCVMSLPMGAEVLACRFSVYVCVCARAQMRAGERESE